MRAVAIDWSGEKRDGGRKKIWMALSSDGHLRSLENGRTREQVAEHLLEMAEADPTLVVGFDFAFSMPAWFVRYRGATDAKEFWRIVDEEGESWLRECPWPFFGHKGTTKPVDVPLFRRTEREVPDVEGRLPKSVFQISGGGQVGPGSIRGMPILDRLASEGFRIWPFDTPDPSRPLVVEIYPRLLTGSVIKSGEAERAGHLEKYEGRISKHLRVMASQGEDQFDAAISAAVMDGYLGELVRLKLEGESDPLEGQIWFPRDPAFRPGEPPC